MKCTNGSNDSAHPCSESASYRYTWPGKEPAALCTTHMRKLAKVAIVSLLAVEPIGNAPAFDEPIASDVVRDASREPKPVAPVAPPAPPTLPAPVDDSEPAKVKR